MNPILGALAAFVGCTAAGRIAGVKLGYPGTGTATGVVVGLIAGNFVGEALTKPDDSIVPNVVRESRVEQEKTAASSIRSTAKSRGAVSSIASRNASAVSGRRGGASAARRVANTVSDAVEVVTGAVSGAAVDSGATDFLGITGDGRSNTGVVGSATGQSTPNASSRAASASRRRA